APSCITYWRGGAAGGGVGAGVTSAAGVAPAVAPGAAVPGAVSAGAFGEAVGGGARAFDDSPGSPGGRMRSQRASTLVPRSANREARKTVQIGRDTSEL